MFANPGVLTIWLKTHKKARQMVVAGIKERERDSERSNDIAVARNGKRKTKTDVDLYNK